MEAANDPGGSRPSRLSLVLVLVGSALFFLIPSFRMARLPVAFAAGLCLLLWPLRTRLGAARWVAFPLLAYVGAMVGLLLTPAPADVVPLGAEGWLGRLIEVTHPSVLFLGPLYVGGAFLVAAPFFPHGGNGQQPARSVGVVQGIAFWVGFLGSLVWSLARVGTFSFPDSDLDGLASTLTQKQVAHRDSTGQFILEPEELGHPEPPYGRSYTYEIRLQEDGGVEMIFWRRDRAEYGWRMRIPPDSGATYEQDWVKRETDLLVSELRAARSADGSGS